MDLNLSFLEELGIDGLVLRLALTILALVILWIIRRIVGRMLIPQLRKLAKRTDTQVDDVMIGALTTPIRLIFVALSIWVAASLLSPDGISPFFTQLSRSLLIIAVVVLLYKSVHLFTRSTSLLTTLTGLKIDEQLLPFTRTALQVALVAVAIVIILQEWQYDVGGLIAGLGLGGLAFALAAQDTVANLFGFTTIVGDRPLAIGDFIATPDVKGSVEHVGFRSTRVRQLDKALVTIPNSKLAGSVVTNWSRLENRRIDFTIGVTYATNSNEMRTLLERIKALLATRELVQQDTVTVLFTSFGASSLDVLVRCYVDIADWKEYMEEQQEIMLQLMDLLAELGLDFAFPSRSVYIEQMPQPAPQPDTEA